MRGMVAALATMVVTLCASSMAGAAPLRIEARPSLTFASRAGVALDAVPRVTFVADAMPAGFAETTPTAAQPQGGAVTIGDGTHTIDLAAEVATGLVFFGPGAVAGRLGFEDVDARDEDGVLIAIGRRSRRAPGHIYLRAGLSGPVDATASDALAALGSSLDGWWGLDPLTTSDASNGTVLAALKQAATRTAVMPEWYLTWTRRWRAGWKLTEGTRRDFYFGARRSRGRQTLVTTNGFPRLASTVAQLWRAPGHMWIQDRRLGCTRLLPRLVPPTPPATEGALSFSVVGPRTAGILGGLLSSDALAAVYDLATKPPLRLGARGTRYEIYYYPEGFRVHGIFLVGRDGTFRTIKVEILDAQGRVIETTRAGITTHIPAARTRPPGRVCS